MIKKVGLIIILIVTIFNLIIPMKITYAEETKKENVNEVMGGIANESADSLLNDGKTVANAEGGSSKHKVSPEPSMGGATASALAKLLNIIPTLISALLRSVVNSQQISGSGTMEYTIQDLLSGKYDLFSIDFFGNANETEKLNGKLTQTIIVWYSAIRNLAVGLTLLVLVYVGIRMAISTVASEEAKYKSMLKDWLVSFVLVFMLQYIIAFTLNANNALVGILEKAMGKAVDNSIFSDVMDTFALQGVNPISFTIGFGSAIAFCILVGVTMSFLVFYIKRMLTLAFLVIISPIVTITYSIDKMGDKQSQALNKWVKEFVYTVLIQPFQCLIYIVFATTALDLMQDKTLGASILGCIMLLFIHQAEHIVRGIFSFEHAHNLGDTFMTLAVVKSLGSSLSKIGQSAASGSGGKAAGNAPAKSGTQTPKQTNQGRNNANSNYNVSDAFDKARKTNPVISKAKQGAQKLANTKAGKALGFVGKPVGWIARKGTGAALTLAQYAPQFALTAIGAGAGGMNGAIVGYTVGKGAYKAEKNIINNAVEKRDQKTEVRTQTGQAYNEYIRAKGLQDRPDLAAGMYENIARDVLQGKDINKMEDPDDQKLAQSLAQYKNTFEKMGVSQENIAKDMEKTLIKMQELQTRQNNNNNNPGQNP